MTTNTTTRCRYCEAIGNACDPAYVPHKRETSPCDRSGFAWPEPTNHTYWISIGRNVGAEPSGDGTWRAFKLTVEEDVTIACGGTILTTVSGTSEWEGIEEATYLLLVSVPSVYVGPLRHRLKVTAEIFEQDAIGFVGGPGTDTLIVP